MVELITVLTMGGIVVTMATGMAYLVIYLYGHNSTHYGSSSQPAGPDSRQIQRDSA